MVVALGVIVCLLLVGALVTLSWGEHSRSGDVHHSLGSLVGRHGVAQGTFVEDGMILIQGELWKAESRSGIIEKGCPVEVVEMLPGLRVVVKRVEE